MRKKGRKRERGGGWGRRGTEEKNQAEEIRARGGEGEDRAAWRGGGPLGWTGSPPRCSRALLGLSTNYNDVARNARWWHIVSARGQLFILDTPSGHHLARDLPRSRNSSLSFACGDPYSLVAGALLALDLSGPFVALGH